MNTIIRIALADHSRKHAANIRTVLQQITNYRIIFEVLNGQDLFRKLKRNSVDIVLINFQMPFNLYSIIKKKTGAQSSIGIVKYAIKNGLFRCKPDN